MKVQGVGEQVEALVIELWSYRSAALACMGCKWL